MDKKREINEKLELLYNCIKDDGGIYDLAWCSELLYPYYKHFHDENKWIRSGAVIAFCGLLQDWDDGSGFPFYTKEKTHPCHDFEEYIKAFMVASREIKSEYPYTYRLIATLAGKLDRRYNFNSKFPFIEKKILDEFRSLIIRERGEFAPEMYDEVLREIGIIK